VILPLDDETATLSLARRLALAAGDGDFVALGGTLGMGKTAFARGFIRALTRPDEEVPSPTFTLVQSYETERGTIWHLDLYRLKHAEEIWELGFEEVLQGFAVLIEWPERLGALLPARRLDLTLAQGPTPDSRVATLAARGSSDWLDRAGL
jgi:tRNA threonylcarbamoyladenosine biosynthesis protein TsaE